jgi:hypothetical protein
MQKISIPTAAGKSNSQFLPRNGCDPAAVQQWSNEVRLCAISPSNAPGHFEAVVNGELLVRSSTVPFCDAARVLLDRGVDSNSWLILRHAGSDIDSLRAKVGVAAKLTVAEGARDAPRFRHWKPRHFREGSPPMLKTASARLQGPLRGEAAPSGGAAR